MAILDTSANLRNVFYRAEIVSESKEQELSVVCRSIAVLTFEICTGWFVFNNG